MNKQLAIDLIPLVNSIDNRASLEAYVGYRISDLLRQLETARDMEQVRAIQGAVTELRRFSTLRDEVLQAAGENIKMDDMDMGMEIGFGFAGKPLRGEKKKNGDYVLPKEVVEYHGLKRIRALEDEAGWGLADPESDEDEDEMEEDEDEKPKTKKSKGFSMKKNTKTTYIK